MKTALVTGSSGFIGRHMVERLTADGFMVDTVDLKFDSDCLDLFRGPSVRPYDLAVHCAAVVGGRQCIDGSPLSVATNLALDSWYFRWLELGNAKRAVYFSSSAAYPVALQTAKSNRKLIESDVDLDFPFPARPDSTYGLTKLVGEQLARECGVPVTVVRPFSGYGEDQSLDYPFPSFALRAARHQIPFDIWGDGEQVRDWVHVDDVVGATLQLVEDEVTTPVNVGNGVPVRFRDLARMFIARAGYNHKAARIVTRENKPSGVAYRCCDPTKMLEHYRPRVSLDEGIRRAIEYARR